MGVSKSRSEFRPLAFRVIWFLLVLQVIIVMLHVVLSQVIAFNGFVDYDRKRALIQLNVGVYLFPIMSLLSLCVRAMRKLDLSLRSLVMPICVLVASIVSHWLLMYYRPLGGIVLVVGEVDSVIISLYEPIVVSLLYVAGLSFLVYSSASRRWERQMRFFVGGVLTIIGVCFPKIVEGYGYLGYLCEIGSCSVRDRYVMDYFASVIAMSISLLLVYLTSVIASGKQPKLPRVPSQKFGWVK